MDEVTPNMKLSSHSTPVTDIAPILNLLGLPLLGVPQRPAIDISSGELVERPLEGKPMKLRCYRLPDFSLPSGKIFASDAYCPIGDPMTSAFHQTVKPGTYPLLILVADLDGDEPVVFAMLRFSEEPVVRWEMAIRGDMDASKLEPDEIVGYGTDSGLGCFADPNAWLHLGSDASPPDLFEKIDKEINANYKYKHGWLHIETPKGSVAMFSLGFGDSNFCVSYFGLNSKGKPVVLLSDLEIVDWPNRPQK